MSPTIWREKDYRFFFFSREESRIHIHITCADGEAKYWLEPDIELAKNHNLSSNILLKKSVIRHPPACLSANSFGGTGGST